MDDIMWAAILCEKFGWTLQEHDDTPASFLEICKLKMRLDGEYEQRQAAKTK